jgi:hypothetical protein
MVRADSESIYWFFSTAAESIAAFVAFLLTGYTLVHTLMETAREKDGTLDEIHSVLKKRYHRRLTWLAAVTGAAIVLSLMMLLVAKWNFSYKVSFMAFVSLLDLAAIVLGLMFVVSIVDPAKHERAAVGALEDIRRQLRMSDAKASPALFFEAFTSLERLIRNYLEKENLSHSDSRNFRNALPFQEMIQILFSRQKIDQVLFEELKHLNAYRNIVFHGHVKHADQIMIEKTKAAAEKIGKWV